MSFEKTNFASTLLEELTTTKKPMDGERSEQHRTQLEPWESKTIDPLILWLFLDFSISDTILCPGDRAMKNQTRILPSESHVGKGVGEDWGGRSYQ